MVYALGRMSREPSLPFDFLAVYREAAFHSEQVIHLTDVVNGKIERINTLDLEGKHEQALALIREADKDNTQAREEALQLSLSLEELAKQLQYIHSSRVRHTVFEAIETEFNLVHEFLSYTQSLSSFLDTLNVAIVTDAISDRLEVERYLEEVNSKRNLINELNSRFLAKVGELGI